jgi:serine/threonine-protein kinase
VSSKLTQILFSEAVIGIVLTLCILGAYLGDWSVLEVLEQFAYDARVPLRAHHAQSDHIELVAIDDDSIAKVGRWPWPRSVLGQLVDNLKASGAKVIAIDVPLSDPDRSQGVDELHAMRKRLAEQVQSMAALQADPHVRETYQRMLSELGQTAEKLDHDAKFAAIFDGTAGIVLPIQFTFEETIEEGEAAAAGEPSESLAASQLNQIDNLRELSSMPLFRAKQMVAPLPVFQKPGVGFGHINVMPGDDGVVRREPVVIEYQDHLYPSFALRAVSAYLDVPPGDVHVLLGRHVQVGGTRIPVDEKMRMRISYNGGTGSFKAFSAHLVLAGKIPPNTFHGKLVLIGLSANTVAERYPTPLSSAMPSLEMTANVVQNVLEKNFIQVPRWAGPFELGVMLFVGAFLVIGIPWLDDRRAAIAAGALLLAYVVFALWIYLKRGYVIAMVYPTLLLALGYLTITAKRMRVAEHARKAEAETLEARKQEGLTLQSRGELDAALEQFKLCPMIPSVMELLYNLALDFERKRQFTQATRIFQDLARANPQFRDVQARLDHAQSLMDMALFGGKGKGEGGARPTLGRYEVVRELGRGAMGVVFLGSDPKIQRQVAIKTLRLDEVDKVDLPAVKKRFFQEAESAGKLSHPNIVTIFDAGEEHDLAYIAMEFLHGGDLKDFCQKDRLMPVKRVAEIVAKVAEALDYAHSQGVIHRDIKPANIMLLPDGSVKVADFGIARVSSATKTKTQTSVVLGTPSYMSPEQIAGGQLDGRSDLFALGVVLYELLTGERPFQADTVPSLMYMITNQTHTSALTYRSDLPKAIVTIIDKALEKDPRKRYQRGLEMAQALRLAMQNLLD